MSGFPHGLEAPPHGDALLRPGKDYELRGNEIVAVPNRSGGGMNMREVLERYAEFAPMTVRDLKGVVRKQVIQVDVLRLATDFERALRASAQKMALLLAHEIQTGAYGDPDELIAKSVTAGVAAMMEESDE